MNEKVYSNTTGKTYSPKDVCRILNMYQLAAYMKNGIELLDIYAVPDRDTGKSILVGIVDRESSRDAYDLWCKRLLV